MSRINRLAKLLISSDPSKPGWSRRDFLKTTTSLPLLPLSGVPLTPAQVAALPSFGAMAPFVQALGLSGGLSVDGWGDFIWEFKKGEIPLLNLYLVSQEAQGKAVFGVDENGVLEIIDEEWHSASDEYEDELAGDYPEEEGYPPNESSTDQPPDVEEFFSALYYNTMEGLTPENIRGQVTEAARYWFYKLVPDPNLWYNIQHKFTDLNSAMEAITKISRATGHEVNRWVNGEVVELTGAYDKRILQSYENIAEAEQKRMETQRQMEFRRHEETSKRLQLEQQKLQQKNQEKIKKVHQQHPSFSPDPYSETHGPVFWDQETPASKWSAREI